MRTHAHIVQEFTVSVREHRNHWNLYWSIALNFGLVSFNRSKFQWPTTATTIQIDRPANQLSVNWDLFLSAVAPLGNPFIMYIKKKPLIFAFIAFVLFRVFEERFCCSTLFVTCELHEVHRKCDEYTRTHSHTIQIYHLIWQAIHSALISIDMSTQWMDISV